jgi:hypothetical protein
MTRAAALVLALATIAAAQSEAILREHFEGRYVSPKLDMPGDSNGIDLKPGEDSLTNDFQIRTDLQRYGTAIRRGQRVKVTGVHVKKDHIEFHLDGGGFGSFKDRMTTSNSAVPKSSEETRLERERRDATGSRRRYIDTRLRRLREEREEDERIMKQRAAAGDVTAMSPEQIRRRTSGSRFNIRYTGAKEVPKSALTPESVQAILAPYVEFDPKR